MAINSEYKKKYIEKVDNEDELCTAMSKIWNSPDINKDPHFFGRAVGNAIEDSVNNIVRSMEKTKADSKDRAEFIAAFFSALSETLKATKKLHKLRNGEQ